ncbi:MAG: hypothetical protein QW514_00800 [Thermoprotei archaeon]
MTHFSKVSKRLIVKSKEANPIKGYVTDKTGYIIGKVDEVFGPVDEPYYAIKPRAKIDPSKYLDEEVFLVPYPEEGTGESRKPRKTIWRARKWKR